MKCADAIDVLEGDEREELVVVSLAPGGLVSVMTASGARLVLPRGHLAPRVPIPSPKRIEDSTPPRTARPTM